MNARFHQQQSLYYFRLDKNFINPSGNVNVSVAFNRFPVTCGVTHTGINTIHLLAGASVSFYINMHMLKYH